MDLLSLTLSAVGAALLPSAKTTSSVFSTRLMTRVTSGFTRRQTKRVCEESGLVTHLLGKGLLQSGQGGVGVGGVRLQGLDSLLQAAHLLFLISKLLLEVFNLSCE